MAKEKRKHVETKITNREAAKVGALVAALPQGKDLENHSAVMAERLAVKANKRASTFEEVWACGNAEFKSINRSSVEEIARHFFLLGCATTDEAAHLTFAEIATIDKHTPHKFIRQTMVKCACGLPQDAAIHRPDAHVFTADNASVKICDECGKTVDDPAHI